MRKVSAKQQAQWEHEALERKFAKLQADYDKLKAKDVPPKPGRPALSKRTMSMTTMPRCLQAAASPRDVVPSPRSV